MGMVSTHAAPMVRATPQRTADSRLVAPTPMIADVIVWVVETGAWTTSRCTVVAEATPAPVRPPIRAWVEEDGSPNHHVIRFHAMAPMRPARTMVRPCSPDSGAASMIPAEEGGDAGPQKRLSARRPLAAALCGARG